MTNRHKYVLSTALAFLGVTLLIPGVMSAFSLEPDGYGAAVNPDALNQLRALNAMMAAVGAVSLWCCFDLGNSRQRVRALGLILLFTGSARVYSYIVDGVPGPSSGVYLTIEFVLALLFLAWPPSRQERWD